MGAKYKFWYWHKKQIFLFKEGRPGTGENWAEKICGEICTLLSIPHVDYDLAIYGDKKGVICQSMVSEDKRLILGNELLGKLISQYDKEKRFKASQHTVRRVLVLRHTCIDDYLK